MGVTVPRLVIAGLSGDSGKTIVSLSLLATLRRRGLAVSVFKKGPDYIDAAWLGSTAGRTCRNLDTYMVPEAIVRESFVRHARSSDCALIEGNRGLFDGKDIRGTHSTAGLARLVQAPVVLVINATKMTRTVAAIVRGCQTFDPDVRIVGVVLNKVAGKRHGKILAESIREYCGIPVLGMIPKLGADANLIPGRHLGLVPPTECRIQDDLEAKLVDLAASYLDVDALWKIARSADTLDATAEDVVSPPAPEVRVGYFRDSVFTFYYPENLEALQRAGAELVPVSSLDDSGLPDIDGLYIGGGFPETHAEQLAANRSLMTSVREAAENGLPIYAECGGLIYLSRSLTWRDKTFPMAGVFELDLELHEKPVGHGYSEVEIDHDNPCFARGTTIRGHEFHYSGPTAATAAPASCMQVRRGTGIGSGRDGLVCRQTLATYLHIHADGVTGWADAMVRNAQGYRGRGSSGESDPGGRIADRENDTDSNGAPRQAAAGI